jgi:hypothetical protein
MTFEEQIRDLECLLGACERYGDLRQETAELRASLGALLVDLKGTKNSKETYLACQIEATSRLNDLMGRAKEEARRLRALAKAHLGTRNELLVEFNVKPLRPLGKRGRRAAVRPSRAE